MKIKRLFSMNSNIDSPLITYYSGQYKDVANVFYDAVHNLAKTAYSQEQLDAWAPKPLNYAYWRQRCEWKRPFVCLLQGKVVGFIELDTDGHIDCHYVHSAFAGRGVGAGLLSKVLEVADGMGLEKLYVEASHLAKGLYEKFGFVVVRENVVERRGVRMRNWGMERLKRKV